MKSFQFHVHEFYDHMYKWGMTKNEEDKKIIKKITFIVFFIFYDDMMENKK